jgi:aminopeptidase N
MRVVSSFILALLMISSGMAQRLPQTVLPENYNLTFAPDFAKKNFEGDETIRVRMLESSNKIVVHAVEIEFHEVTVTSGGNTQSARVTLDKAAEMATFTVDQAIPAGAATIHIRYTGILNDQLRGFYLGKDDQGRPYAATQLEDTDARRAFPSFDEPMYKATFDVIVIADRGLVVISNGKVISDKPMPEGKHTVHFATTPKMSSYLVAVVVGQFEYIEGSADGIPIRVYASPGKKELGRFALEAAEFNLHFYDQYFGIKYPYGKLDLVGLADFSAGAMENTGCITFREVLLLLDDKNAAISLKKVVASVISHEMAHQWFGDLVTMKWWDDKWLNEGFATWMSSKPVAAWKPDWEVDVDNATQTVHSLQLDSLANTHPIHQPADTPAQILELDDAITYGKTAAVLRMLESYLGPETFRGGVNHYLRKYSYQNAAAADFWTAHAEVSKKPVGKIMSTWVEQAGAPLLTATATCVAGSQKISFEQQRYFFDRSRLEQGSPEIWEIPVCVRSGSAAANAAAKCELVTEKKQVFDFPGCAPWDFVNAGAMGFYRSGYGSEVVRAMAPHVETALTPAERILLLSDVMASVTVNREKIGDYLLLAEGLKSDRHAAVIGDLLLPELRYIGDRLTDDADAKSYSLWVRNLLSPIAKDIGWTPKPGERESVNALRGDLLFTLVYSGHDPEAQSVARNLAEQALKDPDSVNREVAEGALRAAAFDGDEALYDTIMADLKNARTPEIYYRDTGALSRFRNPKLVERTLQFALTMRSQDSPYMISAIMQRPATEKQAWQFVQEQWPSIEKLGGAFAGGVIVQGTSSFCDAGMRDQVKTFFTAHPGPAAERSLKQAVERINICLDLKAQQQEQLATWLKDQQGSQTAAGEAAAH